MRLENGRSPQSKNVRQLNWLSAIYLQQSAGFDQKPRAKQAALRETTVNDVVVTGI